MKIAIVGAGAAGLAAAYDLSRAGHEVIVFEAGAEVGGLAAGFKDESWDWTLETRLVKRDCPQDLRAHALP